MVLAQGDTRGDALTANSDVYLTLAIPPTVYTIAGGVQSIPKPPKTAEPEEIHTGYTRRSSAESNAVQL